MLDDVGENGRVAVGEKQRARDILAALRTLQDVERRGDVATPEERATLARFGGFGPVALHLFPDPVTGRFRDGWDGLGRELAELLTPDEYASARRTTFNAFYTSPTVMQAIWDGMARLGLPQEARVLEPGCGIGNFLGHAPEGTRLLGVEMDSVSGRIARALHPQADIRIENFRDTLLPPGTIDGAVGNVPFADITYEHGGQRLSLHDYFFAKTVDALAPGGVLGLVTSRYTMDKVNAAAREYLADRADFLGAIRLPDEAFRQQGTRVVTDIVFLRRRGEGEAPAHAGDWIELGPIGLPDGREAMVNRWFAEHPDLVLGEVTLDHGMYGNDTLRVRGGDDYRARLAAAIATLPEGACTVGPRIWHAPEEEASKIPPGLGEGAFFVAPDKTILQIEAGRAEPVTHGATVLKSDGGLMGRRLADLIGLRDAARVVLKTQNEGRANEEREGARRELNRLYSRFVSAYGPINKTTRSRTADGTEIRRMPNLARFREDPDAFLVASLEEYDDATGRAERAPIMRQDVVGPSRPVMRVETAEDGLLVSLNERGRVDLPFIARLCGRDQDAVIAGLGSLIFHDPAADEWVTRDAYLSGNVRRKLIEAEASADPRHAGNVAALRDVQPEDLLPGDIDANLGAPWLPPAVIRDFVADLLQVAPGTISIGHLPRDAVWSVEGGYEAKASVANTADYGTRRIDGLTLIEQALNLRTPAIYDEFRDGDTTKRVLNQTETVAAREKQKRIKQRFAAWVFADPDRAEELVRLYNDTFNNLRVRRFDGSHLTFPGMSNAFQLRSHQSDGVWRVMADGNTLLAHVVGAGKTACMAASAMKLKQTGLVRKSVIVVPNHCLEQFGREFLHVYPNARLLVAGKEDLARDRRKLLTAKIATGDWDAVVMTHSSFERIGMSAEWQRRFIQDQIDDYGRLLADARANEGPSEGKAQRNIIKAIEKRKAAYEDKLKELSAEAKKDDGLVFDELGVDQIFCDEFHHFKNLECATKMDRVAGIQTTGSQRAFDMYMKARYLDEQTPGRGLVGATGTPISNSMVEMYTMTRYLAPALLRERGIDHFDAWAAAFGEVVDNMEISPDGSSLRLNSRFAKFVNLPELQQIFRSFADVQTADMLKLPVPALKGGKADVVACPMSMSQQAIQAALVDRYERIRRGGVDPRDDNALAITTDGRKLALDARLLDADAEDWPDSKLNALIDRVAEIRREQDGKRGTQLIFCDIGVNPTAWGFSVYDEIKRKLVEAGVPAAEIADIGEAGTDAKKEALFERMRTGQVRVLIGSTAKMGTGTNVQKRLVAVHHLDAPWKPAEIEQRDGRILRQGNRNKEVEIVRYVTEASFDAYMWQTLENKARFIAQVMRGDAGVRRAGDIGGQELSFAEVKAIASGNPAVLTLAEIEAEIQRLALLARSHADDQYRARMQVKSLPEDIERLEARAAGLEADHGAATPAPRGERRDNLVEALNERLKVLVGQAGAETKVTPLGSYRGLALAVATRKGSVPELQVSGELTHFLDFKAVAAGSLLNRVDHLIDDMPGRAAEARARARMKRGQLASFGDRIGLPFDQAARLERLGELRNVIEAALSAREEQEGQAAALSEAVAEFEAMKGEPVPVSIPVPSPPPAVADVPEDLAEEEPAPAEAEPEPIAAPRPATVLDMTRTRPVHQGNLFEVTPPTPAPEPARSFRQMVASGRKAQQLKLF